MGSLFGTDGIRGRAGRGPLAPRNVECLGAAVARLLRKDPAGFHTPVPAAFRRDGAGNGRVLIGRDTRASGPEIERALARGLRRGGAGALLAGVIPTPGVAHLTRARGCALGAVISASHNPAGDNGIKFFSPEGFKIPDSAEAAIEKLIQGPGLPGAKEGLPPRKLSSHLDEYLRFLASFSRPLRGLKIAVDCAHGAASRFAGPLLRRLGARAVVVNAAPDGANINAGCGALHPEKIARIVRREKAHLGVAFDGDADRAMFADERGELRDGDHVLALAAVHLREKKALPRDTVVSTVMANFGFERYLAGRGIALRRTKVGDRYVAEEMLASGAVLGGEPSGHILFFDASPAGDGLLTMLRVLDILAERGGRLGELTRDVPKFPQVILNIPVSRRPPIEKAAAVRKSVAAAERELGADGRILVRYSGTEPLCRVMVEGADAAQVGRLARGVADAVKKELA